MIQKIFYIDGKEKEAVDYLSRLSYECESHKSVVASLIDSHKTDETFIDTPLFKKYHERYEKALSSFQVAKDTFSINNVPKYVKEAGKDPNVVVDWNLDFNNYKLTLTFQE